MRFIIIIFLSFLLVVPTLADEVAKPFAEMTASELTAVDVKTLSKVDKKLHKKALRAAKKVEKARKSAEKKAEKARVKAEKNRAKAAEKKLKKVRRTYNKTTIDKSEFSSYIEISGPKTFIKASGGLFSGSNSGFQPKFSLVSFVYPATGKIDFRAYTYTGYQEIGFNPAHIEHLGISTKEYGRRKGYWDNFESASLTGGAKRKVLTERQATNPCNDVSCSFKETTAVYLSMDDLVNALQTQSEIAFKLRAKRGHSVIFRIPYQYLVGYTWKLSELNSNMGQLAELAKKGREAILNSQ